MSCDACERETRELRWRVEQLELLVGVERAYRSRPRRRGDVAGRVWAPLQVAIGTRLHLATEGRNRGRDLGEIGNDIGDV